MRARRPACAQDARRASSRRPRAWRAAGARSRRTRRASAPPPRGRRSGRAAPRSTAGAAVPRRRPSAASPARRAAPRRPMPACTPMRSRTAGTTPSGCSTRTQEQVRDLELGDGPRTRPAAARATIASVARWVNRSVRIGLASRRDPAADRSARIGSSFARVASSSFGSTTWVVTIEVALLRRAALRQAATLDADDLAVLGVRADAKLHGSRRRRHRDLGAEERLGQGERPARSAGRRRRARSAGPA